MPGMDKTVLGWILSGGATHWTAGGLQAWRRGDTEHLDETE